jgi:hypothetical protein
VWRGAPDEFGWRMLLKIWARALDWTDREVMDDSEEIRICRPLGERLALQVMGYVLVVVAFRIGMLGLYG